MGSTGTCFRKAMFLSVSTLALAKLAEAQDHSDQSTGVAPGTTASTETQANSQSGELEEIVVTAQKREQSIDAVGMSINATTGDQLVRQGITSTADLVKIVPGFNFTETSYATPVYTIRGVGFQETTLASSPAVSVYVDEIPIPFPIETTAAGLDLERVEVLKGPQGTLYGENSTGGAVNYVAAKPTANPQAGFDLSYGRFDAVDFQGYASGPITDTLRARVALRVLESDGWQQSYTSSNTLGQQDQQQARLLLDWRPLDRLKFAVNVNGWRDASDTPAAQLIGISPSQPMNPLDPAIENYPRAPANDRAAGWDFGTNYRRHNYFFAGSLRGDYDLGDDMALTSISSWQHFTRNQPQDQDGTPFQDADVINSGHISTFFQELRLSGKFPEDKGTWIVGGNYERDNVFDKDVFEYQDGTVNTVFGVPTEASDNFNTQQLRTHAIYGNAEYQVLNDLSWQGAVRFTQVNRDFTGCTADSGNGKLAEVFDILQGAIKGPSNVVPIANGGCVTLNQDTLDPGIQTGRLDQNNVSWRTGPSWTPRPNTLLYFNVSKGYKAGSFPTLAASFNTQFEPVSQESLLAYEGGFKVGLLNNTLEVRGAGYYYDYTDKQIRGRYLDPIFGALEALVNVPKSRVIGFELSADWRPIEGLTISPAVTMVNSKIEGNFTNYTILETTGNFSGEAFPYTPEWQSQVNINYRHPINAYYNGFIGGNVTYQSATNGGFGDLPLYNIRSYTLVDLQAGVETASGKYRLTVWGRNVTNEYYWMFAGRSIDTDFRYAGMPATYGVTFHALFR
jgi:iron complex outermembrane recepter protein